MLSKRKKQLARDLFDGRLDEAELSVKYGIRPELLVSWLSKPEFQAELDALCERSRLETRLTLARYGPVAALRLAELIGADKEDVARRAALDMIDRVMNQKSKDGVSAESIGSEAAGGAARYNDDQVRAKLLALTEGWRSEER